MRFQSAEYLDLETPAAMFRDGRWKWEAPQRFAGRWQNCGHFFARTPEGAEAEAAHYQLDTSSSVLWEVDLSLDRVLNLTDVDTVRYALNACLRADDRIVVNNAEILDFSYLCVPRISSTALTSRVVSPAVRP